MSQGNKKARSSSTTRTSSLTSVDRDEDAPCRLCKNRMHSDTEGIECEVCVKWFRFSWVGLDSEKNAPANQEFIGIAKIVRDFRLKLATKRSN